MNQKKRRGFFAHGAYKSKVNDDHTMGTPRGRIMDIIIRFLFSFCLFIRSYLSIMSVLPLHEATHPVKKADLFAKITHMKGDFRKLPVNG